MAKSLVVGVAVAGVLVGAPLSASANPTKEVFNTKAKCEKRAAEIRDTTTGAWCEHEGYFWRLHISGS